MKKHQPDSYHISQKLFIRDKNKLLIFRLKQGGILDLPGGRINTDEFNVPLKQSLLREAREEVGADLKFAVNLKPVVLFRHQVPDGRRDAGSRIFLIGYEAEYLRGLVKLSNEHSEYFWQDLAKIKKLKDQFFPGVWEGVRQYLNFRLQKVKTSNKRNLFIKIVICASLDFTPQIQKTAQALRKLGHQLE